MAVVHFEEVTGRDGSEDIETVRRYRRVFQVLCDTPQDGASVVLAHPLIPQFGDAYEYIDTTGIPATVTDTEVVAVERRVEQGDGENLQNWRVTVEYAGVTDPEAVPAEVEYSPTRYQVSIIEDINDPPKPVVNTAGDPFEGGITVDRTRGTLVIVRNKTNFDPVEASKYNDTLNEETFLGLVHPPGFAPGTCKLTIGAKRLRKRGRTEFYWQVRYEIDIDRRGWKVKVRNAGYRELVGPPGSKEPRPIMLKPGVNATSPQLLAADGTALAVGAAIPPPLEFDGYETKPWSPLGIEY